MKKIKFWVKYIAVVSAMAISFSVPAEELTIEMGLIGITQDGKFFEFCAVFPHTSEPSGAIQGRCIRVPTKVVRQISRECKASPPTTLVCKDNSI